MKNITKLFAFITVITSLGIGGCGVDENRGREYMPDMGHSVAYEANIHNYYSWNTWGTEDELKQMGMARKPVQGTIPRGYAGVFYAKGGTTARAAMMDKLAGKTQTNSIAVPVNGAVPYYYADTDAERERAKAEIRTNPFPASEKGLAQGKALYDVNCGICHGKKADGNGTLYNDGNGPFPAAPANFMDAKFISESEGLYYHAIMHGKGMMGSHADKLSYEERWTVIHYIRSLQAKKQGVDYKLGVVAPEPIISIGTDSVSAIEDAAKNTTDFSADALKGLISMVEEHKEKIENTPKGADAGHGAEGTAAHGNEAGTDAAHGNTADNTATAGTGHADAAEAAEAAIEKKALVLNNVQFKSGSAWVSVAAKKELDILIKELKANKEIKIQINGHTDDSGKVALNKALSEKRAKAVKAYLVSKGLNAKRLSYKGYGPEKPIADNKTEKGRQENRRTDFNIVLD